MLAYTSPVYTCLCQSHAPLKNGLARIRIGNCSKLAHNNPVGSHVPTVSFTAQVTTLVCDPTCGCDKKGVRKWIHIRQDDVIL